MVDATTIALEVLDSGSNRNPRLREMRRAAGRRV